MATITANVTISKTVTPLDATTIDALLKWLDANIKQKLPADTTLNVIVTIIP